MSWFFIALIGPILWALVNIFDKYLVSKFSQKEKERSSGGLVLFSSLIGIFIAFFILIFTPNIFSISFWDKVLLMITGVLTVVWIILYLFTLETEDVSSVVPWFLTVPVFGFILGYIFLGETLSFQQIIGSFIIMVGVFIVSLNFSSSGKNIKGKTILYLILACFLVALTGIIFKFVTIDGNFWISSFWEYLGLGIAGIVIFMSLPEYRSQFMHMNKKGGRTIFLVNIASELMTVSGNLLTNFALLLAPVTMVYLVGSFQPAFVLFLGIIGTKFFPHIAKENLDKYVLFPKITAIGIMIIGSIILFM